MRSILTDSESRPQTVYAAQQKGQPGWQIYETQVETFEEARESADDRDGPFDDIREIWPASRYAGSEKGARNWGLLAFLSARHEGWQYDMADHFWYPPNHLLGKEVRLPPRAGRIGAKFHATGYGSIDVTLSLGIDARSCYFDDLFSPFQDMLDWLEGLARGEEGAFCADVGGTEFDFVVVNTKDSDWVQFCLLASGNGAANDSVELRLNGLVERRELVREFYHKFRRYVTPGGGYDPVKWRRTTVEEDLAWRAPQWTEAALVALDGKTLSAVFDTLYPHTTFDENGAFDFGLFRSVKEAALRLRRRVRNRGLQGANPAYKSPVPLGYDNWPKSQKRDYIQNRLAITLSDWDGEDLIHIKSKILDDYVW